MDESSIDGEREALNRRREEVTRQLQSLTAQDGNLDGGTAEMRRDALLSEIREIDCRLADLQLDEESLRRMEGGE
jgi:hypothetical protein